ncbi:hypothetical protein [endosymbiont of Lamellibrachia barhami]|uniref:hypothetical protein n=1 Tax=endosymbiont of Lamellibrachia barhami TaxID=205975 RepID=UPI0015A9B348|nr:hypothetical protein [endosymbiont of Lamellibrachia barhami]
MLTTNNLNFNWDSSKSDDELVSDAFLIKVYNLYQRRNEWGGIFSKTTVKERSWEDYYLTLQDARDSAEEQRTQGTVFIIDEIPAICIIANSAVLLAAQLMSDNPFKNANCKRMKERRTLSNVNQQMHSDKWYVSAIYTGQLNALEKQEKSPEYYAHTSNSTGPKSFMAWRIKPRDISIKSIIKCINSINYGRNS